MTLDVVPPSRSETLAYGIHAWLFPEVAFLGLKTRTSACMSVDK